MTKSRQNWKARYDDLKAENERLKEKCECQEADIDLYRDDIEKLMMDKDNLEKQLLDKTSSEEVLRKAIEEVIAHIERFSYEGELVWGPDELLAILKKALAGKEAGK